MLIRFILTILSFLTASEVHAQQPILWGHGAAPRDVFTSLSVSRECRQILTTSLDGTWQRWSLANDTLPLRDNFDVNRGDAFCSVIVNHGSELLTGGDGVYSWNFNSNQFSKVCTFTNRVRFIDSRSDGMLIAAFTENDLVLHLYDRQAGREVASWKNAYGPVVFSPDGRLLLAALDQGLSLIDVQTRSITHRFSNITSPPFCLAFSPTSPGQFALCWAQGGLIMDTSEMIIGSWPLNTFYENHAIDYSPDGTMVVAATGSGLSLIRLSDMKTWFVTSPSGGELVQFLSNDTIISTSAFGIGLFSANPLSYKMSLAGHNAGVGTVLFSRNGRGLLSASDDGTMKLWGGESGMLERTMVGRSRFIAASSNFDVVVAAAGGGALWYYSSLSDTGRLIDFGVRSDTSCSAILAFSPTDSMFAEAVYIDEWDSLYPDSRNFIRLWRASDHTLIKQLDAAGWPIYALKFSRDGSMLYASCADSNYTWDTQDGHRLNVSVTLGSVEWPIETQLPDGIHYLIVRKDDSIYEIDKSTWTYTRSIPANGEAQECITVNPVTGDFATGTVNGSVIVWKALGSAGVQSSSHKSSAQPLETYTENGRIVIRVPGTGVREPGRIFVYRSDGRCFYSSQSQDAQAGGMRYTTGPLPAGVYFVVFQSESGERRFAKVSLLE